MKKQNLETITNISIHCDDPCAIPPRHLAKHNNDSQPKNQRKSIFNIKWDDMKSDGKYQIEDFNKIFAVNLDGDEIQISEIRLQVSVENIKNKKRYKMPNILLFKKSPYTFYLDNSRVVIKENSILVNYIKPKLYIDPNIALVGSSKRLLNKTYGDKIDSYNEVFRFNRAPIAKFEKYVGNKTTYRVVNCHVFANQEAPGYSEQPQYFIKDLRHTKILVIDPSIPNLYQINQNTHDSCMVHSLYTQETANEDGNNYDTLLQKFNIEMHLQLEKPGSLGLNTILLLINSGITPHLFGFDLDVYDNNHYWEDRPRPHGEHDLKEEKGILKKLIKEGKVIYHE